MGSTLEHPHGNTKGGAVNSMTLGVMPSVTNLQNRDSTKTAWRSMPRFLTQLVGMPPVSEQMALNGSRTHRHLVGARFLLKPGRKYEEAKKNFSPYDRTHEVNEEARNAAKSLVAEGVSTPGRKTFIFVNNRLEGN